MQPNSAATATRPIPENNAVRYDGPTYYDRPAIKPSPYGWLVWAYIYVAGIAGGSQVIATIANLTGSPKLRSIVRNGRYIGAAGSAIGSILLIADLHTPQRWYNMMRIFRSTSPMSIGSYILTSFGAASAVTAATHVLKGMIPGRMRQAENLAQIPAALAGAGMSTYTGALLSSTSTPMWAATPKLLSARFASSALAASAAALSLAEHVWGSRRNSNALDKIACVATAADAALTVAASREYRRQGVASSLNGFGPEAAQYKLAQGTAHLLPLVCYGLGSIMPQHERKFSVAAAVGVLAGSLLMRAAVLNAGNSSANSPHDYFSFTQPRSSDGRLPGR